MICSACFKKIIDAPLFCFQLVQYPRMQVYGFCKTYFSIMTRLPESTILQGYMTERKKSFAKRGTHKAPLKNKQITMKSR